MQWQNYASSITTIAAIVLAIYVLVRSRTPEILRGELQVTREKCDRLENENKDLTVATHIKDIEIADLRAKTDLSDVRKSQTAIFEILSQHSATHIKILELTHDTTATLQQLTTTLASMAARLDKGLVMK